MGSVFDHQAAEHTSHADCTLKVTNKGQQTFPGSQRWHDIKHVHVGRLSGCKGEHAESLNISFRRKIRPTISSPSPKGQRGSSPASHDCQPGFSSILCFTFFPRRGGYIVQSRVRHYHRTAISFTKVSVWCTAPAHNGIALCQDWARG